MRRQEIREHVEATPFRPFRVWTSSGEHHDVKAPNLVLVTAGRVMIGVIENDEPWPERVVYCDPRHITHIETLETGDR